jgi:hypothetical protein
MNKYKIAYIDEVSEDIRDFQRFASDIFDVIPILPIGGEDGLDKLLNSILENHIDAVVVDHNLIEFDKTATINYLGNDVVNMILERLEGFPVFVLTSYDEDAIDNNEDAKIVFEKKLMYASKEQPELFESGIKFKKLINKQIEKYKVRLEEAEKKLLELINLSKERQLDAFEEQELIKLDGEIERSLDKESQIPDKVRKMIEEDKLSELLNKVDDLAKKLGSTNE